MIEVEIKVRISDPELILKKFEENNGIYKISLIHEDIYFNMPVGLRDFKITDEALRLRKSIEFNKHNKAYTKDINHYITYKGKKIDTSTKTREEIEVKINDPYSMRTLLKELGFQEILTVKKERDLYEFEFKTYQIDALIDYLPLLNQYFIEVELLLNSSKKLEESKEALFDFLCLFGIKKDESIRKSYLELITEKLKEDLKN
ncbi:MAG: class IV adenylate cyclase [Promethearchaeota archaeon]|nr:MAG: class IV adenylate cyclase [Candidatus Lokiarchaeota archaeon]